MHKHLSVEQKLTLIKRVLDGEKLTVVAKEAGVTRISLYNWIKSYKKTGSRGKAAVLTSKIKSGKAHWKSYDRKVSNLIIKIALQNPHYSYKQIAIKAGVSANGAWNVLSLNGLSSQESRQIYFQEKGALVMPGTKTEDKLTMLRRFDAGEKISLICRDFKVSRQAFYLWLERYMQAQKDIKALQALRPKGERHYKYIAGAQDLILQVVRDNPVLSAEGISKEIVVMTGKRIIGHSCVHTILKRLNLSTSAKRIAFAAEQAKQKLEIPKLADVSIPPVPRYSFISFLPPPLRNFISSSIGVSLALVLIFVLIPLFIFGSFISAYPLIQKIGYSIAFLSLLFGVFFLLYSLKYYISIAIVLSFSRKKDEGPSTGSGSATGKIGGIKGFLAGIFGVSIEGDREVSQVSQVSRVSRAESGGVGLTADLSGVVLERNPFVSVHVSSYNEKRVIDRLLTACTSFDYPNYEVIVADDSNDETVQLIEAWANHPRVKISHRENRDGYKGAALKQALKLTDPRAEFVVVFDADFIPYPDSITQFLKYFQLSAGGLDFEKVSGVSRVSKVSRAFQTDYINSSNDPRDTRGTLDTRGTRSDIAAVQGYQWHVLNKSENWITRGVRSEYWGSYVIERSGAEIYSGLKQISGSVYMIRKDVLQEIGWGKSITEDFEFTLRLYEAGYKVVYTPYIQTPAEAVSTVKRLIRQRMRWAEGHSFNIKKMLVRLLFGQWIDSGNTTSAGKNLQFTKSQFTIK